MVTSPVVEAEKIGPDSFDAMVEKARTAGIFTESFELNIYSFVYSSNPEKNRDGLGMDLIVLREVVGRDPDGVFIIIESNCELL